MADSIIEYVVAALAGGGSSILTTALRVAKRFTKLEEGMEEIKDELASIKKEQANHKEKFLTLPQGFKLELISLRQELEEEIEDNVDAALRMTKPEFTTLEEQKRRLENIERQVERLRNEQSLFLKTEVFASFTEEQARQWYELQRSLGRIEGSLKRLSSPPTKSSNVR